MYRVAQKYLYIEMVSIYGASETEFHSEHNTLTFHFNI